jgi:hypothetical protein
MCVPTSALAHGGLQVTDDGDGGSERDAYTLVRQAMERWERTRPPTVCLPDIHLHSREPAIRCAPSSPARTPRPFRGSTPASNDEAGDILRGPAPAANGEVGDGPLLCHITRSALERRLRRLERRGERGILDRVQSSRSIDS